MKILLAVDGSRYSTMSAKMLMALRVPPKTSVTVMTVIPEHTYIGGLTLDLLWRKDKAREQLHKMQQESATQLLENTVNTMKSQHFNIETLIARGSPAEEIIKSARDVEADLILIGAKGLSNSDRFPFGSVTQRVMKHAGCSVLLVKEEVSKIRRVIIGIDGSEYSDEAARFLMNLPLPRNTGVFLVSALHSHTAALMKMPTLDLDKNQQILAELQAAEEIEAGVLLERTEKLFQDAGYNVSSFIRRGNPAAEILSFTKTLNPEIVAVGSKGLTGIESFLMGSVAQRVARFSSFSVLIVRPSRR